LYNIYYRLNLKKSQYPTADLNTTNRIKGLLKEDIENLEKLLDKDLSAWK
jgi:hypothetical protein